MPDQPGPAATGRDATYALSIDDAVLLYVRVDSVLPVKSRSSGIWIWSVLGR